MKLEQIQEIMRFVVDNEKLLVAFIGAIVTLGTAMFGAGISLWKVARNVTDAVEIINPKSDNVVKEASRKLKEGKFQPITNLAFKLLTRKHNKGN